MNAKGSLESGSFSAPRRVPHIQPLTYSKTLYKPPFPTSPIDLLLALASVVCSFCPRISARPCILPHPVPRAFAARQLD